jgi:uncharacterized protein (DUF4415 family)
MAKKERIERYSASELAGKLARGEDRTDWVRVKAKSQEEVERLADEEEGPLPDNWEETVICGLPQEKTYVRLRLDADIIDWFKSQGEGYQRRINAALRAFIRRQRE